MAIPNRCLINIQRDDEAGVWVATSEDIPGLILESEGRDALMKKVCRAVPELLAAGLD